MSHAGRPPASRSTGSCSARRSTRARLLALLALGVGGHHRRRGARRLRPARARGRRRRTGCRAPAHRRPLRQHLRPVAARARHRPGVRRRLARRPRRGRHPRLPVAPAGAPIPDRARPRPLASFTVPGRSWCPARHRRRRHRRRRRARGRHRRRRRPWRSSPTPASSAPSAWSPSDPWCGACSTSSSGRASSPPPPTPPAAWRCAPTPGRSLIAIADVPLRGTTLTGPPVARPGGRGVGRRGLRDLAPGPPRHRLTPDIRHPHDAPRPGPPRR